MNTEQRHIFGERLKTFRQLSNITQSDIVDAGARRDINFTRSQVSMIERGLRDLTFEILVILNLDFNCETVYMITGQGPMFARGDRVPKLGGSKTLDAAERKITKNEAATEQLDKAIREVKERASKINGDAPDSTFPAKPHSA